MSWDAISDDEMRSEVMELLAARRAVYNRQAERNEALARNEGVSAKTRRESEACARYSRRQAAHYQQAIDLLSAAPMPERSES